MKSRARSIFWWPLLDQEIEKLVKTCNGCSKTQTMPPRNKLTPWDWPKKPWQRIHVDFFGPLYGKKYMVLIDAHSKWAEVAPMSSTTAQNTIEKLRGIFACFELPHTLVSNNGSPFDSEEFNQFTTNNGVKHIPTPPYHPQNIINKSLFDYRNTPHTTTGETPAKLMFVRALRTRLDLLRPGLEERGKNHQTDQERNYRGKCRKGFELGENVMVRNYRDRNEKWVEALVLDKIGYSVYLCKIKETGVVWKRHIDQIWSCHNEDMFKLKELEDEDSNYRSNYDSKTLESQEIWPYIPEIDNSREKAKKGQLEKENIGTVEENPKANSKENQNVTSREINNNSGAYKHPHRIRQAPDRLGY
ncbi:uncharacterized protein K02A2.6-like [Uloborus diversus]|uniref:uncharacterized protein K02A2.6-like n=1 Tax=Uloborus diversus TaxID=327109 RepID=UPI002409B34A|nr:uncharacterized protein K02A2.6-like [Uloborus diversus]